MMNNKRRAFLSGITCAVVLAFTHPVAVAGIFSSTKEAMAQSNNTAWVIQVGDRKFNVQIGKPSAAQVVEQNSAPPGVNTLKLNIPGDQDKVSWAIDLLAGLGNREPTLETVLYTVAWQQAENTEARYNPIATTQDMPGATTFNSDGVKDYNSYQDGVDATVKTLGYSYNGYADIREGLATNDPERALRGLYASPWGTNATNADQIYRELLARVH